MKITVLLKAVAVVELLTGIGLLLAPSLVANLLLGQPLASGVSLVVARVAGMALIAIGLVCWLESVTKRAGQPTALLLGLLAYNGGVPLLLLHSYIFNDLSGIGLWPAVGLHLAFSAWIAACIRSQSTAV